MLNKHLKKYNFHGALACSVCQNDWLTLVDLKDVLSQLSIYLPNRKFLHFAYQGACYEFTVLPFGLSLSPRVFGGGLSPTEVNRAQDPDIHR